MGDAAPVLDAILDKCEQLIDDATGSSISLIGEDGMVHVKHFRLSRLALAFDASPAEADKLLQRLRTPPPEPLAGSTVERVLQAGRPLVYRDIANDPGVPERLFKITRLVRRSYGLIAMPLIKEGRGLGMISVSRHRLDGFSDKEIALLQTFADQAVIAIENARLFNETKEALERQTATAEILKVIASSPADTQPIFDAIVQSAVRLCNGVYCAGLLVEGRTHSPGRAPQLGGRRIGRGAAAVPDAGGYRPRDGARHCGKPDHSPAGHAEFRGRARHVARTGHRHRLPDAAGRADAATRPRHRRDRGGQAEGPFSDREMALLATFADQAVIAIQNVRLFNETQEALERQTATADVLKVISQLDLRPAAGVRQLIRKLPRGCARRLVVDLPRRGRAVPRWRRCMPRPRRPLIAAPGGAPISACCDRWSSVTVEAVAAVRPRTQLDDADGHPRRGQAGDVQQVGGYRSLSVPLMREGVAIGVLTLRPPDGGLSRQGNELLTSFADQAAIAIENVRLFNETQEALERQTATTECSRRSPARPSDLQPVLDTFVSSAARLCQA